MDKNKGTPKTLREAIKRAITNGESDVDEMYYRIRDFISQKFQVAVMKHPEFDTELMDLFNKLVK